MDRSCLLPSARPAWRLQLKRLTVHRAPCRLLKLYPALAIRHAGGQLFQEAHFELIRGSNGFDLFGLIGNVDVQPTSRGGTHFTPPALARSIVEQTLAALPDIAARKRLSLCDPACGSGAFLHEALRALRRAGFNGKLTLVGRDVSIAAIAMARFVMAAALKMGTRGYGRARPPTG